MQQVRCALLTIVIGLVQTVSLPAQAAEFVILHTFSAPNGTAPNGVTRDDAGNLFGTTGLGGRTDGYGCVLAPTKAFQGCGTIFRMSSDGRFEVLHFFKGGEFGSRASSVVVDGKGTLYVASRGVYSKNCDVQSCGLLSKLGTAGQIEPLHAFSSNEGRAPRGLILDRDGNIYGVTIAGGDDACPHIWLEEFESTVPHANTARPVDRGCGTIFHFAPSGQLTTLHAFTADEGGGNWAHLALAPNGTLHGSVSDGKRDGIIFKINTDRSFHKLHSLSVDENQQLGRIVVGGNGTVFGAIGTATDDQNCNIDCGLLFSLEPNGAFRVLHKFSSNEGQSPAPVGLDAEGNLYGVAPLGGKFGRGSIFKLRRDGNLIKLHDFLPTEGAVPRAALGADGNIYGTTLGGGPENGGTVFEFKP